MRLQGVFRKGLREQKRDLWLLVLTLITAPFFVFLYGVLFGGGSTTYGVLVLNSDTGVQMADRSFLAGGNQVIEALKGITYADGQPILKVSPATDRAWAEARLRNRDAAALVIIPPGFSRALAASPPAPEPATTVVMVGDLTNPQYAVAAVMADAALDQYIQEITGRRHPVQIAEEPLGASAARTEFENYVPGLMIFAVVMLIFPAAMTLAREVEAGTLRRLQLTRMTSFDLLGGVSALQVLIGVASLLLTFLSAWALGFRSQGPLWVAVLAGALTGLSVVGVGLVVAAFSRTVTEAFLIANFPLFLLMFFTGAIYPVPRVPLFTMAGQTIGLYDVLPPTHAVVALNKVLTLGLGLGDVVYELVALVILSAAYFAAGIWLFQRRHLRAQ